MTAQEIHVGCRRTLEVLQYYYHCNILPDVLVSIRICVDILNYVSLVLSICYKMLALENPESAVHLRCSTLYNIYMSCVIIDTHPDQFCVDRTIPKITISIDFSVLVLYRVLIIM